MTEKQLYDNYSKTIDEMLEEAEKAKESGMVVSVEKVINILKNEG
ncbi:hypothetical protein [Thomasclavelia spiroformis]|nr:hypothetical protein [Thomasclavelia spiroformis]